MAALSQLIVGRSPRTGRPVEVRVRDGLVESVAPGPADADPDVWLAPGLVDLQVNGYAGYDFNVGDPAQVAGAVLALAARGTSTVVPTVITGSELHMQDCLRALMAARRADPVVARGIPAIHVEGPFLSPVDGARGAHDERHIRAPDLAELQAWLSIVAPLPLFVTIAPEWEGALEFIRAAVGLGVTMSLGHSVAQAEQITAAVSAGATLSTHLGNGAPLELPRHPNLLWAQLAAPELSAGLIADGFHLDGSTLRAMIKAKGPGGSFLVSDAVALAGRAPGRYTTPVGGEVELDADGRLRVAGRRYLAGAALDLAAGVARLPGLTGFSIARSVRMATGVPGRVLARTGVDGRGRTPRAGERVDLIRFRWAAGDLDLELF